MVASLTVRVMTGASAGTQSAAVTGIDFISADNATNSLANRTTNPVTVGTNSFEKHIRLAVDTSPANGVTNFKFWGDGVTITNVAQRAKLGVGTGGATPGTADTTPVATAMTGDVDATTLTAAAKGTWDTTSYVTATNVTKAVILQIQPNASATPGNLAQKTWNYSYDET